MSEFPVTAARKPGSGGALLTFEDLCVDFATDHGWARVVDNLSFDVQPNEIVGLVGESGSGKSVTSLAVLGLIPQPPGRITSGHIWYGSEDLVRLPGARMRQIRGNEIAMIFQEPMTSLNPAFTIGDQIAESYRLHQGVNRKVAHIRAIEMLDLVGIPNSARRVNDYPHEFSGGMRQRAMIAMALVNEPKLLIADEPTTALDVTIQAQILDLLYRLRDETGTGIIFITHDLGVVAEICDRVVVMYAGQTVEHGPSDVLFDGPSHPYTEGLLQAMPQMGSRYDRLASIPGSTPEPWAMPQGCRFNPRCAYQQPVCTQGEVVLRDLGDRRQVRCELSETFTLAGAQ